MNLITDPDFRVVVVNHETGRVDEFTFAQLLVAQLFYDSVRAYENRLGRLVSVTLEINGRVSAQGSSQVSEVTA